MTGFLISPRTAHGVNSPSLGAPTGRERGARPRSGLALVTLPKSKRA
jgi:hypothetical protein